GPLLDACGQVIGVNTLVRTGPMRSVNIALTTEAMQAFLRQNGHRLSATTTRCAPKVRGTPPPPPAQPQPESTTE
ncbi:MAG: serine protease, partial [Rhodobacteraceae bacterium]|nr:serine protease [Paracoccaceae bacterium]